MIIMVSIICRVAPSYRAFAHRLFHLTSWQLVMQVLLYGGGNDVLGS